MDNRAPPAPVPLLLSVFVVATCGLVYELVAGALASYLLGDSVTQFSTVIGVYLFAMGVGSYLSRFVERDHLALFVKVELMVGILGGFSSTILFFCFSYGTAFPVALYGLVFLIGTGVGLEIPLLMNVLHGEMSFKDLVSRVLSFDYIGALVASVAFPLLLLPNLGLIRTSLLFGIFNVLVSLMMAFAYHRNRGSMAFTRAVAGFVLVIMVVAFAFGDRIMESAEASIYPEPIIHSSSTQYQRVVLTRSKYSLRLYLNGHLQFDSMDEYRYHEALVHVGLHRIKKRDNILILGGGDGMAAREVLKYPDVKTITLVDLDPGMTTLFTGSIPLQKINGGALTDPRVSVINDDAFVWLRNQKSLFDFIIIDFPDPTNFSLGKLYTTSFYREVERVLSPTGFAVIQSTSPLMARQSFWCIETTVKSVGLSTEPYHAYVPSFGEWGFILASKGALVDTGELPAGLKYISKEVLPHLFHFPADMEAIPVEINRLNTQNLVHYYEKEWARYGM
jgi:spermidine synthase